MATPLRSPRRQTEPPRGGFGPASRGVLLLVFALLVAAKLPNILLLGRFWAEEGALFLLRAWQMPWYRALFAPWAGYLNLTANLGGILAWHLPPLAWAPYVTSALAMGIQLCPAILLLSSRDPWLQRRWVLLAALLLVLTVPAADEVWLSSIESHFHLNLCAGIILALAVPVGAAGLFRLLLLLLGALSGPGSWVLTPLFVVRAVLERSWRRAGQAAALGLGVLLQLGFFYTHHAGRPYAIRPLRFLEIAFSKHMLLPFIGLRQGRSIGEHLYQAVHAGHVPRWPIYLAVTGGALAVAVFATTRRTEPRWLALAAAFLAGASYIGSMGDPTAMVMPQAGGRYAFAPQALLALAVLAVAATQGGRVGLIAKFITLWWIAIGVAYFFDPVSFVFATGPGWRRELSRHIADPSHVVASWPPGWIVPLPPPRPDGPGR
jgi:hypothetical protein